MCFDIGYEYGDIGFDTNTFFFECEYISGISNFEIYSR